MNIRNGIFRHLTTCSAALAFLSVSTAAMEQAGPSPAAAAQSGSATALFGATGHVGAVPLNMPPEYESWYSIVVVEVDSPARATNVAVSGFRLIDSKGGMIEPTRTLSIEEFDRPRAPTEGEGAYWANPGGTRPWNGTLPAGKIRLRIRAAFADEQWAHSHDVREFTVTVGTHVIGGMCSIRLPS